MGYTFILSDSSIVWAAQKQCTVTLSSTEAEYMALTECSKHAQWMISILQQLFFKVDLPIDIFCDLDGTRSIASNNVDHKRMKHIDIKHHYIREKISDGTVNVNEVSSEDNAADVFTKALPQDSHQKLTVKLGLIDASIEGDCWKVYM